MSKKIAAEKIEISNKSLDKIVPGDKPRIVWDTRLTGFGIKVMPSGTLSFIVNYRADGGGRKAPNRRMTIGRHGKISVAKARQKAQEILGEAAGGKDPSKTRQEKRAVRSLGDVFEAYMLSNPNRKPSTNKLYRYEMSYLKDWHNKPIDAITRTDVQERFNTISTENGPYAANRTIGLLAVSTARLAPITKLCAIRWSFGRPGAGVSTRRVGVKSIPRPTFSPNGTRGLRRSGTKSFAIRFMSVFTPACVCARCCGLNGPISRTVN